MKYVLMFIETEEFAHQLEAMGGARARSRLRGGGAVVRRPR
ncbi:hypothetical protein ACFSTC_28175 [Nonomuraea ferruginea]